MALNFRNLILNLLLHNKLWNLVLLFPSYAERKEISKLQPSLVRHFGLLKGVNISFFLSLVNTQLFHCFSETYFNLMASIIPASSGIPASEKILAIRIYGAAQLVSSCIA